MKRWAKVCILIGAIWIAIVLIGLGILFYFYLPSMPAFQESIGGVGSLVSIIDNNHPFVSLFPFFMLFAIPSWILFLIAGIWGRN